MMKQQFLDMCINSNDSYKNFKHIIHYQKDRKNRRNGVFVAFKDSVQIIYLGWSRCSKRDKFNRDIGLNLAFSRAAPLYHADFSNVQVPNSMRENFRVFINRACRYFKIQNPFTIESHTIS